MSDYPRLNDIIDTFKAAEEILRDPDFTGFVNDIIAIADPEMFQRMVDKTVKYLDPDDPELPTKAVKSTETDAAEPL